LLVSVERLPAGLLTISGAVGKLSGDGFCGVVLATATEELVICDGGSDFLGTGGADVSFWGAQAASALNIRAIFSGLGKVR
jgi:hypothetical protein